MNGKYINFHYMNIINSSHYMNIFKILGLENLDLENLDSENLDLEICTNQAIYVQIKKFGYISHGFGLIS